MKIILKCLYVILLILINVHSQVIINERIEIEPKIHKKLWDIKGAIPGPNRVTITFINENTSTTDSIRMNMSDCVADFFPLNDDKASASNTISYTSEYTSASQFGFYVWSTDPIYGRLQLYFNYTLIVERYITATPYYDMYNGELLGYRSNGRIILPVLSTFSFNINGFLGNPLGVTGIVECMIWDMTWTDVSNFTLNLSSGSEYIGFYNTETYQIIENTLSCPYEELNQWRYIPLKQNYEPVPVSISTSWNGITKTSSSTLAAIVLRASISTGMGSRTQLSPSDEYFLRISAGDPDNLPGSPIKHRIEDEDKISIETISPIEYATFYDYRSEQRGANLLNLDHDEGALSIRVYMDGPIPTETDTLPSEFLTYVSTFPNGPLRTVRATFTAHGSPVKLL